MDTNAKRPTQAAPSGAWKGLLVGLLVGGSFGALMWVAWRALPQIDLGLSENRLAQQLSNAKDILTVWDILAFPVLMLVVLGTHEIGHVFGGLSQGMRFLLFIVGPFSWHASSSGPRFVWNTDLALMPGLAAMLPTRGGASRRQFLVFIAGGPLASLLLAILAIASASISDPRFAAYFTIIAGTSLGIFLATLIPVRLGGFKSDGLQIIDVLRGDRSAIERNTVLHVFAQSLDGVRPRDWDSATIDELSRLDSQDPMQRASGLLYLLARAMDCQDHAHIARYRSLLEESVGGYPSGFRQSISIELAICAWLAGDADAVRRHINASKGGFVERSRRLLAQAALARLEGRDGDCERDRLLAIDALAHASDAGQRKLTEDQLAMLQARS